MLQWSGSIVALHRQCGLEHSPVRASHSYQIPFCPKTRAMTSRRFAVVEVEHSIEPPAPVNRTIICSNSPVTVDQSVTEPLMVSFPVAMIHVFGHSMA